MHVRAFVSGRPVAAERALARGAEVLQIFASSPRMWRLPKVDPAADAELVRQLKSHGIRPLFIHAPYLVNPASPTRSTRELSISTLAWNMERAEALSAEGVVVHSGLAVGRPQSKALAAAARAIEILLGSSSRGPRYIVELTAGASGSVASRIEDAEKLFDACGGHPRLAVCLDTCHLHAAGYDLSGAEGVGEVVDEVRARIGIRRLRLIHANDSRDPRGSRRDRHWHVGRGYIGRAGFASIVGHPRLQTVPMICETPGQLAEDRRNIRTLKRFREGGAAGVTGRAPARNR